MIDTSLAWREENAEADERGGLPEERSPCEKRSVPGHSKLGLNMSESSLRDAFQTALQIPAEQVTDGLQYNSIRQWDSVGHMALVAEIESRFAVVLSTDEILGLSSFAEAKRILQAHGIDCNGKAG